MPAATDKIPDKIPFNVYAMLIILTFVFTGAATWMMGDDLAKNWHYFDKKEEMPKKAVHITQINSNPEQFPNNFQLTDVDKEEWELATKSLYPKETIEFPVKGYEWPAGYDPLKYSVQYNGDNLNPSQNRPDQDKQIQLLMKDPGFTAGAAAEAPKDTPKDAAPAAPAPAPAPVAPAPAPEKKD